MEQQTPIPQIKDEAVRRAKTCYFPILDFGGEGTGGGCRFSMYFVQNKMDQQTPIPPNLGWSCSKGKNAPFSHPWFGGGGWGKGGGSRFFTYFVQHRSPLPINNDKPDKKDKSPFVVFKLSFILACHLRKTFLQFTDINHYEVAFNSLNYVPPRKPRLPVMILHRQISDI